MPCHLSRRSLLLAATAALCGCAMSPQPVTLTRTRVYERSDRQRVRRQIAIGHPEGTPPPGGWPVLLVLDGNALFPSALQITRNLAQRAGQVPALVVGIGYPGATGFQDQARARDFTPPVAGLEDDARFGGAGHFLDAIQDSVLPLVADEGGNPGRIAAYGHSYGGLLVLHALFTRPGLFQTHAAGSPSIWWQNRAVLATEPAFTRRLAGATRRERLLITVGELEQTPAPDMPAARAEALRQRGQVDNARALAHRLTLAPNLECVLRELPGERHGGAALPGLQRAIEFALGGVPS